MTTEHKPHSGWQDVRTRIVTALNLPPLVAPQADDETINIVNEAWGALYDGWLIVRNLEEQFEVARQALEEIARRISSQGNNAPHDVAAAGSVARSALASFPAKERP